LVQLLVVCKGDPAFLNYKSALFPLSSGNKQIFSGPVEMIIEAVSLKEFTGKNHFCVI
jgi:hypothetical protein